MQSMSGWKVHFWEGCQKSERVMNPGNYQRAFLFAPYGNNLRPNASKIGFHDTRVQGVGRPFRDQVDDPDTALSHTNLFCVAFSSITPYSRFSWRPVAMGTTLAITVVSVPSARPTWTAPSPRCACQPHDSAADDDRDLAPECRPERGELAAEAATRARALCYWCSLHGVHSARLPS
jgi:hypothetical protein